MMHQTGTTLGNVTNEPVVDLSLVASASTLVMHDQSTPQMWHQPKNVSKTKSLG